MKHIRHFFESIFNNLGLIFAPLAAATLTGLSVYHYFLEKLGEIPAGMLGFAFAFGIEATGYQSFKAFQSSKKVIVPVGYLATVVAAVTVTELSIFGGYTRWLIGLVGVMIAAGMYWADSILNSKINQLNQDIEIANTLSAAGVKIVRGKIVPIAPSSTPSNAPSDSENTPSSTPKREKKKSLRWPLPPEVQADVISMTWGPFCEKYGHVASSTFYNWLDKLEGEKV